MLTNQGAKRKYDRIWTANVGKKKKFNTAYQGSNGKEDSKFSDFFNMFFGDAATGSSRSKKKDNKKEQIKGDNIETEIKISLIDAFFGNQKRVGLRTVDGKMQNFTVKVPPGIRNNEKIRLAGLGKPGVNGAVSGDMFIKIKIEDDRNYRLHGSDLITELYLTPWEAALGSKAGVPCIDGQASVEVPAGICSNETIKIDGKGYKDGMGGRGDLIVEVKIMVPKELSPEEEKLYKEMQKISKFTPRKQVDIN